MKDIGNNKKQLSETEELISEISDVCRLKRKPEEWCGQLMAYVWEDIIGDDGKELGSFYWQQISSMNI